MKNIIVIFSRNLCLMLVLLSISGCSLFGKIPGADKLIGDTGLFRDRQSDYLEAETIPRTQIPAGMDSYVIDDLLVIPGVSNENSQSFIETPRPRPMGGTPQRGVVIQRMDEKAWVVVNASASEVWPRIKDYWASKDIALINENPTAGIMETNWFVLGNDTELKEKFRVNIEPGFQDDSSEVNLLHISSNQESPSAMNLEAWPEVSENLELETEILTELSTYLAEAAGVYQASSVSFLAGNISTEGKASMGADEEGNNILRLESSFERSWAAIGRALARADVEIVSQDQNIGTYDVSYELPEEESEPGFLSKLVTLNGLITRAPKDEDRYSLQVKLEQTGSVINVVVSRILMDENARIENEEEAKKSLLQLISDFIA